jgi:hypothetical protein
MPDIAFQPNIADEAEYERFRAGLVRVHQPADEHEAVLVEEFIGAAWDLQKSRRVARIYWSYVGEHYRKGEIGIAQAQFQEKETRFRCHFKYRLSAERSYYRALNALNNAKKLRGQAATPLESSAPLPDLSGGSEKLKAEAAGGCNAGAAPRSESAYSEALVDPRAVMFALVLLALRQSQIRSPRPSAKQVPAAPASARSIARLRSKRYPFNRSAAEPVSAPGCPDAPASRPEDLSDSRSCVCVT